MVKIREGKPQRRTALLSLIVAAAVAGGTFVGWRLHRRDSNVVGRQRAITDVTVTWECDTGERFEAPGAYGPRACGDGTHTAEIILRCTCPEHGAFECQVRYRQDSLGLSRLSEVRFGKGQWQAVSESIACPICKRPAQVVDEVLGSARSSAGR